MRCFAKTISWYHVAFFVLWFGERPRLTESFQFIRAYHDAFSNSQCSDGDSENRSACLDYCRSFEAEYAAETGNCICQNNGQNTFVRHGSNDKGRCVNDKDICLQTGCYRFLDGSFLRFLSLDTCEDNSCLNQEISSSIFTPDIHCAINWKESRYMRNGDSWKSVNDFKKKNFFSIEDAEGGQSKRIKLIKISNLEAFNVWNGSLVKLEITCQDKLSGHEQLSEQHCVFLKFETLYEQKNTAMTLSRNIWQSLLKKVPHSSRSLTRPKRMMRGPRMSKGPKKPKKKSKMPKPTRHPSNPRPTFKTLPPRSIAISFTMSHSTASLEPAMKTIRFIHPTRIINPSKGYFPTTSTPSIKATFPSTSTTLPSKSKLSSTVSTSGLAILPSKSGSSSTVSISGLVILPSKSGSSGTVSTSGLAILHSKSGSSSTVSISGLVILPSKSGSSSTVSTSGMAILPSKPGSSSTVSTSGLAILPSKSGSSSETNSTKTIAISVSVVLLVIIASLAFGILVLYKRRRKRKQKQPANSEEMRGTVYEDPSPVYEPLKPERGEAETEHPYQSLITTQLPGEPPQGTTTDVYDYIDSDQGGTNPALTEYEYSYAKNDSIPRPFGTQHAPALPKTAVYQTLEGPGTEDNPASEHNEGTGEVQSSADKALDQQTKNPVYQILEEPDTGDNPILNNNDPSSLDTPLDPQPKNPVYQTLERPDALNPISKNNEATGDEAPRSANTSLNPQQKNPVYQTLERPDALSNPILKNSEVTGDEAPRSANTSLNPQPKNPVYQTLERPDIVEKHATTVNNKSEANNKVPSSADEALDQQTNPAP